MALLLTVDRIQQATKKGFNQSLGGVDLVLDLEAAGSNWYFTPYFTLVSRPTILQQRP